MKGLAARIVLVAAVIAAGTAATPASAQIRTVDPDSAMAGEIGPDGQLPPISGDPYSAPAASQLPPAPEPYPVPAADELPPPAADGESWSAAPAAVEPAPGGTVVTVEAETTYQKDDLIGAASNVFGEGAEGVARLIEDILADQGEPNAYITGREAGGAIGVGLRYGSGTLHHKVEGERKVYWTGPSIGFDAGASGGSTFVLVYNLWDSQELYERYPAGEGQAYIAAGLNASYLRKGDVVLIPIRMGVGLRLGINAGYMKFSEKQRILPF